MNNYISAAVEILRLTNNILSLVNNSSDDSVIETHFNSIGKIAAQQAAKPEIQGYSEHD